MSKPIRRAAEGGFTSGNFLLLVLLLCLVLFGLRVVPMYLESTWIKQGLESLGEQDLRSMSERQIREGLLKRLDVSNVKAVSGRNFNDAVSIEKERNKIRIVVRYRDERPLVSNLSVAGDFEHVLEQ